ncbi:flagellar motor protein MotB [Arthrobacter ginkgonis]|uniref:Flagellar motor protein MotB n=1 Tax=Arthrobacter ginkgonis TaxID=1630594 RepID=A0ABP7BXM0_9MICC
MSRRGAAKKHGGGGHGSGQDRWMASYMDMVTVLMCLFIVLFAMSSIDRSKYEALKSSLAQGFGTVEDGTRTAAAVVVEDRESEVDAPTDLNVLRQHLEQALEREGMDEAVDLQMGPNGLTVRLVGSETYFKTNSDQLTAKARKVLGAVGPELAAAGRELSIEGHADYRTTAAPYETNWDLSAARAVTVLRHLVERDGVSAAEISATGFGDAQPLTDGKDSKSLSLNRRVDIVVLSGDTGETPAGAAEGTTDTNDAQADEHK